MANRTLNLSGQLRAYLLDHSPKEPADLVALRKETQETFEAAPMQIAPEQGHLLQLLVKLTGAKNILEVGTFTGYSACCLALAAPEDGHVTCCDFSFDWTRLALKYWKKMGLEHKITLHLDKGVNSLQKFIDQGLDNHFDFMFIDADKLNYVNYYELGLQLLRPGGLMAIDNVFWDGAVIDPTDERENTQIIRELNDKVAKDSRVTHCMLPIADGLTLAIKS